MGRDRAGTVRLSIAPLLERTNQAPSALAERAGVRSRQVYRWLHTGVTVWQADELAVRVGSHPLVVWGTAWTQAIDDEIAGVGVGAATIRLVDEPVDKRPAADCLGV